MKSFSFIILQMLTCLIIVGQTPITPIIQKGLLTTKSPRLSNWKKLPRKTGNIPTRDENGLIFGRGIKKLTFNEYGSKNTGADPVMQSELASSTSTLTPPIVIQQSIEGISFTNVAPADPSIAVGPEHIIQMVNGKEGSAYYRIYQKTNGAILTEGFMDEIPGASYNGAGDCITWYDQFEDRYIMTEFGDSADNGINVNTLIIAVSVTSNPMGEWYIYEFYNSDFFPDYPKYGNWNNAWLGMTRDFKDQYLGSSVWAFDKSSMIKGDASTTAIRFRYSDPDNKFNTLTPVSMDGNETFKASLPGLFMYYNDDNLSLNSNDVDSLGIIALDPNFNNPSLASTYFLQSFQVAPFKSNFCKTKSCIPSLTGEGYDAISNRIMNKPYLRKIGNVESIVCNHTVDASGNNVAGLRWYEIDHQNNDWAVKQEGTFAPQSNSNCNKLINTHRFMGSVAINNAGQIAMGFNNGNSDGYASIGFTGRNFSDLEGKMTYEEIQGKIGEGYGTFKSRWGDYNDITTDINDDSLFWFTSMYDAPTGWKTSIVSFKLRDLPELDAKIVSINQPNNCDFICDTFFIPKISLRNNGRKEINTIEIKYQLNGGKIENFSWSGKLLITEEINLELPKLTTPEGSLELKVFINSVNGINDLITSNDSLSITIRNTSGRTIPILEEFENDDFLLNGWSKKSNGNPVFNWEQTGNAFKNGKRSIFVNNFNINQPGKTAELKMPFINFKDLDSISLNFWVAAAIYDKKSIDTLEILVSEDCETNFTSIWKKWGNELITRAGEINTSFFPNDNEWNAVSIDLNKYKGKRGLYFIFRNINGYGNNIFLDDISINGKVIVSNNASLKEISSPDIFSCENKINPIVLLQNTGRDTIQKILLKYKTDETDWIELEKNTKIPSYKFEYINIPEISLSKGERTLTISIDKINGVIDEKKDADTLEKRIFVKTPVELPYAEIFKTAAIPQEWNFKNGNSNVQWIIKNNSSDNSKFSMNLKNTLPEPQSINAYLISPWLHFQKNDSIILKYDFAFGKMQKNNGLNQDTLQIYISKNCGDSFEKLYERSGNKLQTGFSQSSNNDFIPNEKEWKEERINMTEYLQETDSFIIKFNCNISGTSQLYLDNINVFTSKIPTALKSNGYMISPNPFTTGFRIDLYPDAAKLNKIEIYNSAGQLVYYSDKKQSIYSNIIPITLPQIGNGIYFVRLFFSDKLVTKRLIKAN